MRLLKTIGLYVSITVGVTAIGGMVYNFGVKHEQKRTHDSTLEAKVDRLIASDSIQYLEWDMFKDAVTDSISDLSVQLREQNKSIEGMRQSDVNLKNYMMQHAATKEDIMDVLKIWDTEKKKLQRDSIFDNYKPSIKIRKL